MNWCDERYVRLYTRDTADFLALSFEAQGLLTLVIRKLDRAGVLELGKHGKRGVAIAIGHATRWSVIEPALEELLLDGCLVVDGNRLVMPNFLEAQEAPQSDRLRKAESRAKRRELQTSQTDSTVTNRDSEGTKRDPESQNVTGSHEASRAVTFGHSDPSRAVLSRAEPTHAPSEPARVQAQLIPVEVVPRFDFAAVYTTYPRKKGKHEGMAACAKLIRTPADFELLQRAVLAFAAEQKRLGTPPDKIPYWSTFVNERRWEDYADVPIASPRKSLEEAMDAGELR